MLWRIVIGLIICPLLPGLLVDLLATGRLFGIATFVGAIIGYPFALAFCLPIYFALATLKWRGIFTYAAVGTILAFLIFEVPDLLRYQISEILLLPKGMLQTPFVFGLIPSVVFWLFARPDLGTLKLSMSARKPAVQYVFLTQEAES